MSSFNWCCLPGLVLCLTACTAKPSANGDSAAHVLGATEAQAAFAALVDADHWRERNATRDRLVALGRSALPLVLAGTEHAVVEVRRICHEILRQRHALEPEALARIIAGLDDEDWGFIAYPSAFHLGEHVLEAGREPLRALLARGELPERLRAAAQKSLGELGELQMAPALWWGLGSDDAYTRYLSNLGMRGLTGRDLMEFDYTSPWEGAFVSGPNVVTMQGLPVEKARARVERWSAVERGARGGAGERPQVCAELEGALW